MIGEATKQKSPIVLEEQSPQSAGIKNAITI
jgi:hypothetical protein